MYRIYVVWTSLEGVRVYAASGACRTIQGCVQALRTYSEMDLGFMSKLLAGTPTWCDVRWLAAESRCVPYSALTKCVIPCRNFSVSFQPALRSIRSCTRTQKRALLPICLCVFSDYHVINFNEICVPYKCRDFEHSSVLKFVKINVLLHMLSSFKNMLKNIYSRLTSIITI